MHHFAALTGAITLGSAVALEGDPGPPTLVATPIDEPLLNERLLQVTVMRERRLPPAVDQFLKTLTSALRESLGAPAVRAKRKKR
ncbi:LysR family transcriptional regulator [Caballeronia novacaledonica]|uniref:LysR family transcriptional regulator n=1 Tax=Caballeronia novacaledonica TaxID=1544861 RepID=A0A2U3I0E3_9BURK|nr:LysR family transcriptional regulator [Caballeronia novacaledonica]